MATPPTSTKMASEHRRAAVRRVIVAAIALVAALGSAFLWWRTSHVDRNGHIPQPNLAVNVPCLLLQATALRNGLHCVCMTGYPKWKLAAQFERQTYIHEPGYARAHNITCAGFRFVVLTRTLNDTDSIIWPFGAVVFPYWFLGAFFSCVFLYCAARTCFRSPTKTIEPSNVASLAVPEKSALGT